ncbi:MAG: hypothetical protein JNK15_07100 [Planctomycetes bacterium]|nr:hypothetical protein [Planctomycetota bacterium]
MSESRPFLDPKEVPTLAFGFVLGVGILVFFYLLASGMTLPLFAETWALPRQ